MAALMRARRLGGALYYMERNRAMWTADDQYRWNGFLSVVLVRVPLQFNVRRLSQRQMSGKFKNVLENLGDKLSGGIEGGCIGRQ